MEQQNQRQEELYAAAALEFGRALDRLAAGYELNPERRLDLRQEIHFQLWRSLEGFDSRCSLRTWTLRVAHNVAATYVHREQRKNAPLVPIEELEESTAARPEDAIDHSRALERLTRLIHRLRPLDRQIMLLYLEELDHASIAEITGLPAANIAVKLHRIKALLARQFQHKEPHHV